MTITDRMQSLLSSSHSSFVFKTSYNRKDTSEEPTPVQIGFIRYEQNKRGYYAEKNVALQASSVSLLVKQNA